MKYKIYLLIALVAFNLAACKKQEVILNNEDPFYFDLDEGCQPIQPENLNCITKKEDLLCSKIMQKAKSSDVDKIFKNTKWSSPDHEESIHYNIDKLGIVTVLEGGPSRTEDQFEIIGHGRFYKENGGWVYKQSCQPGKCDDISFPIEYLSCDASFHPSDSEYHMTFTIGNRYYDFLDTNKNEKHLSLAYDGTVKPQIRNGFELYLVPPPPK
ncbi:hypothetical protein JWG40_12820 [Leptospira sp. 201903074]|uniref:hypothetical protein n=1 Tax=Leptospira abararensis TaxID=2810036 RepID=UPI00196534EE|nr:hypothetical protein [Leptospira abararensis]MBM9547907.1 hypothetical protein [Leptospira abararensis]